MKKMKNEEFEKLGDFCRFSSKKLEPNASQFAGCTRGGCTHGRNIVRRRALSNLDTRFDEQVKSTIVQEHIL